MSRTIKVKLHKPNPKSPWRMVSIRWRVHAGSRATFNPARIPLMALDLPLDLAQQLHSALGEVLQRVDREEAVAGATQIAALPFMAAAGDND